MWGKVENIKIYETTPFLDLNDPFFGPCSRIHGHNWDIDITFACEKLDDNGFVVDFGKLKYIKRYLDDNLDHACVFSTQDPLAKEIIDSAPEGIYQPYWVENASCEGLAKHLYDEFSKLLKEEEGERVWISR